MAQEGQQNGDIRATLALSQAEALTGTSRVLNLPGGRQVTVPVPAGTLNGQEIRLEGQGQPSIYTATRGALILTIAIAAAENFGAQPYAQENNDSPTAFIPAPPPPVSSFPNYQSVGQPGVFTDYSNRGQDSIYADPTQAAYVQQSQYSQPPQAPYAQPPQYNQPSKGTQRRGLSRGITILLIVLALLIIGGSALIAYVGFIQPDQLHAQATATAQNELTSTAQANATGTVQTNATATAQVVATSQAVIRATATAQAQTQATATAFQNIYNQATSGTPVLNDPLSSQDSNNWEEDSKNGGGGCAFVSGAYHSSMPQTGFFASCYAQATNFSDFAFQVQMTIIAGDRGGIIFRADSANSKFYLFRIDQSGTYDLFRYVGTNGGSAQNLQHGFASALHTGLNQSNQIAAIARGSNIYIFINKQYVSSTTDSTYSSGQIGIFAEDHTNPTEAVFSNAQVWKL